MTGRSAPATGASEKQLASSVSPSAAKTGSSARSGSPKWDCRLSSPRPTAWAVAAAPVAQSSRARRKDVALMPMCFVLGLVLRRRLYHRAGWQQVNYCKLCFYPLVCRFAMDYVFPPFPLAALPVAGTDQRFPIRRVFCVGRNYAEHAREMGALAQAEGREPPFFFTKPADGVVGGDGELAVLYPSMTQNLHHEIEMVVALGAGGSDVSVAQARDLVFAYGVGLDLTRRDMQARAKEKGHPWDMSKGFDQSAVVSVLNPVAACGHPERGRIWLEVNGQCRQQGDLSDMMWRVPEIIANLSTLVRLEAGDLILSGTPAGVGPLVRGDVLRGGVEGVGELRARIV